MGGGAKNLIDEYCTLDYDDFAKRLRNLGSYIVLTLRAHIDKENNILYPTAMESFEEKQWKTIKEKFDEIRYCYFTPKR